MKLVVLQSNFLPWRGYFDLINRADKFVLYDCVQYTKNDWRNRNKILSKNGVQWITLEAIKPYSKCSINEVLVTKKSLSKAVTSLEISYRNARTYSILDRVIIKPVRDFIESDKISLSNLNEVLIRSVASHLDIKTEIISSKDIDSAKLMLIENKTKRLISLLSQLNATSYLTGPSATSYLYGQVHLFQQAKIKLDIMCYPEYSHYKQFSYQFIDNLSIADFLAHSGDKKNLVFA